MALPTGHWYKLMDATNGAGEGYYNFTACSATQEDVRFYDKTVNSSLHGEAICTIDCLMKHKNAILQLIYPAYDRIGTKAVTCYNYGGGVIFPGKTVCQNALVQNATNDKSYDVGRGLNCFPLPFTNTQAAGFIARRQINYITWDVPDAGDEFAPGSAFLYQVTDPSAFGGSLYRQYDPVVAAWLKQYEAVTLFYTINSVNNIIWSCSAADGNFPDVIAQQQSILQFCRDVYFHVFGTRKVGPQIPQLPVIPSDSDRIQSMWQGCQYVYDVSDNSGCPMIDEMCSRKGPGTLIGNWRNAIATWSAPQRAASLSSHLCRSFTEEALPYAPPTVFSPYVDSVDPYLGNIFMAGLDSNPTRGIVNSTEPQSAPSYIYRSCALQSYSATQTTCCANDFADNEGSSIFHPLLSQPPKTTGRKAGDSVSPLFGFNYELQSPHYRHCFDSIGQTCEPAYRDITSTPCTDMMIQHCIYRPQDSSVESWSTSSDGSGECTKWLGRLLYGDKNRWIAFANAVVSRGSLRDRTGTKLTTPILLDMTKNFFQIFTMEDVANSQKVPFTGLKAVYEPIVFSLYSNYDLNLYDGGILLTACGAFGIEAVKNNPMLRRWCGCMLSSESYASRYAGISIECTPTCNSSNVLQYGIPCRGTQCILDGITVSLINSSVGDVTLSQVCQSCGRIYSSDTMTVRQTCDCIVRDVSIAAIGASMGGINIKEICGEDGNGGGSADAAKKSTPERVARAIEGVTQSFPYSLVALLVLAMILSILGVLLTRGSKTGEAHLWARGLGVACIIFGIMFLAAIIWRVTAVAIWG